MNETTNSSFVCAMPSPQSIVFCYAAASAIAAFAMAIMAGAWALDGLFGVVIGTFAMAIPAMILVAVALPVTGPLIWLAACWFERQSAQRPA